MKPLNNPAVYADDKAKEQAIKKLLIICVLATAAALYSAALYGADAPFGEEAEVGFHGFAWCASIQEFTAKMGKPGLREEYNGLTSLVYDKITVSGYPAFMLAYFSKKGLEGGTYYFHTFSLDELMKCYTDVQKELLAKYGPTSLCDGIIRERRPYETSWNLKGGYVYLKVNTRQDEPITLWYSSPALTKQLTGS
jgi:hypothetical protein